MFARALLYAMFIRLSMKLAFHASKRYKNLGTYYGSACPNDVRAQVSFLRKCNSTVDLTIVTIQPISCLHVLNKQIYLLIRYAAMTCFTTVFECCAFVAYSWHFRTIEKFVVCIFVNLPLSFAHS